MRAQYKQIRARRLLAALALAVTPPITASAELLAPFAIRNHNPFLGVYGLPAMQSPTITPSGRSSTQLLLGVASHFTDAASDSEFIAIDGETYRLAVRHARGLPGQWEVGVEVPLVSHSGGFLDGVINEWHEFFGLPTLGRDLVEDDELRFEYRRDGRLLVDETEPGTGLGDALLFAGTALEPFGRYAVTLRGQLKLPTGDPDRLRGSGAVDIGVSAMVSRTLGNRWAFSARLGAAHLGRGEVLPELQRRWAGFGGLFAGWRAFDALSLKAQLDVQSPLYQNSGIDQLTDPAVQLTFGASARLGKSTFLDLSFTEDEINPDVTSDFALQLRLRALH